MDMPNALAAFDALGQPSRLTVFRLLVQTGEAGLAAGLPVPALPLPAAPLVRPLPEARALDEL